MVYCSAFNCNNDGKKIKDLSFFQFPSDEKYRQIWKEKVRRLNWEPNKYSRLCSAHFERHCFVHDPEFVESLGLPRPRKVILKHDAVPTIFDYEDKMEKPDNDDILPRKRKHEESNRTVYFNKGRKKLEVIDFNSLLDDYLKGLQSEEELKTSDVKKGADDLVSDIVPGSSPCEGGDKFVLLLNKPLPESIDEFKRSLLCVRFGDGHVVPVKLWKENIITGEQIPRSEKPGVVTVKLETNDGEVLWSTTFVYKDEICSGFQKIVCSSNYGGKVLKAFSGKGTRKNSDNNTEQEAHSDAVPSPSSKSSLALASILRLMLYIAAKNDSVEFVENLYRTKTGKTVIKSFSSKEEHKDEISTQSTLQQGLTTYIENISARLTTQEEELKARQLAKEVEIEERAQKPNKKSGIEKKTKTKQVKTLASKKRNNKAKQSTTKKPLNGNAVLSECSDACSKTNSLLLLSDIALRHLSCDSFEDANTEDSSCGITQSTSASAVRKEKKSYQSNNARKFTRKILLLPSRSTRLPRQGELLKSKSSCGVNRASVQLENDMTAAEVLQKVRAVLSNIGKKRIRVAAADAKGKLEFFKGTKWTAKAVRQRIKFNSVLYVVP